METRIRKRAAPRTTPPQLGGGDTRRPRLIARLDAALRGPWSTTLVSAPGGSGKTRLLTQWAAELHARHGANVAWLTLDTDTDTDTDTDGVTALYAALAQLADPVVVRALGAAREEATAGVETAHEARLLARAVSATARPTVVIIDDVHLARSARLSTGIDAFARSVAGASHVVLCGRGGPDRGFLRSKLRGVALELGGDDLAFTPQEVQRYFADRGARVSQGQVASILRSTSGSAAALRLVELGIVTASPGAAFTLIGEIAETADGGDELLAGLDAHTREFLIRTAVPESFSAGLARALTDDPHTGARIQQLVRLHVAAEDSAAQPPRYRYHPRLRGALRARSGEATVPEREVHGRAAAWLADQREWLPALTHAVLASGSGAIAPIVRRCGMQLVLSGHADRVIDLLATAPETVSAEPGVRLLRAAAALALGDEAPAVALSGAPGSPPTSARGGPDPVERLWRRGLELQVAVRRGGVAAVLAQHDPSAEPCANEPQLHAYAHLHAGMGALYAGRLDQADASAGTARDLARAGGMPAAELQAAAVGVTVALFRGRLSDTLHSLDQLEHRWRELGAPTNEYLQIARLWRGWAMFERLDTGGAADLIGRVAPGVLAGHEDAIARGVRGMLALFGTPAADDHEAAAVEIVQHLTPWERQPLPPHWYATAGVPAVHALNRLGQLDQRDRLLAGLTQSCGWSGDIAVMHAIARLHDGDLAGARAAVGDVIDGSSVCLCDASMIDAWLVQAALEVTHDRPECAQAALTVALQLAAPEGFTRAFLAVGPVVMRLLLARATTAARGPFATAVRAALIAAGGGANTELTERERVVLRGLLEKATLRAIAEQEYVSMNTVKTHVRNIYRKLGVSDRESLAIAAHSLAAE